MTDFVAELRHRCRNPKCRSKLPAPVTNAREAFCTRGCHSGFYRTRCLVCEGEMVRKAEHQKLCRKAKCRNAFNRGINLGRYVASSSVSSHAKKLDSIEVGPALKADRPWHIVAGPELTAEQLHCATVPDGPGGGWEGGEYQRIEARNRALLREHFRRLGAKAQIQRHHAPVNVLGGYRFPDAPIIELSPIAATAQSPAAAAPVIGDGLDIPDFLRRPKAA